MTRVNLPVETAQVDTSLAPRPQFSPPVKSSPDAIVLCSQASLATRDYCIQATQDKGETYISCFNEIAERYYHQFIVRNNLPLFFHSKQYHLMSWPRPLG